MKDRIRKILNYIPDKVFLKMRYYFVFKKKLDLNNPKTFNEKLQWLKLYDRKPIYTTMVDKYEVRKYISEIIGEKYLIPLIGVWENFDTIDFNLLPDQFVLKCTHDSGSVYICRDKQNFNIEEIKTDIQNKLKKIIIILAENGLIKMLNQELYVRNI